MLFVDMRDGSNALLPALKKAGLPAEPANPQLAFGDLFFMGRGIKGAPVSIGIEHKTIGDLVNSLRTCRLQGHQLPGMKAALVGEKPLYDFAYLVIEGEILYDKAGRLLRRKGRRDFTPMEGGFTLNELIKRVNVMHMCGGLNPVWSVDRNFTIQWIGATYQCWTNKSLSDHTSHLAIYEPPTIVPLTLLQRMAALLPGIGYKKAKVVGRYFHTPLEMAKASEKDWLKIEGIGNELARKAVQTLQTNSYR